MPLLDVKGVTMKFGSLVANDDISFSMEQGQIVGLIGPNGSGKTTEVEIGRASCRERV